MHLLVGGATYVHKDRRTCLWPCLQTGKTITVQGSGWEISLKERVGETSWRRSCLSLVLSHEAVTWRQEGISSKRLKISFALDFISLVFLRHMPNNFEEAPRKVLRKGRQK